MLIMGQLSVGKNGQIIDHENLGDSTHYTAVMLL